MYACMHVRMHVCMQIQINIHINMCIQIVITIIEGSLEVKLPTICRDGKAEVGSVSEEKSRSDKRWRKSEERKCRCAKR